MGLTGEGACPYTTIPTMSLTGALRYLWNTKTKEPRMLKVGEKAPDFTVKDHNGNTVKLSDLRGKKIVLWFYPKADTPG